MMATQGEVAAPFHRRRYGASPGYASSLFLWGSPLKAQATVRDELSSAHSCQEGQLFTSVGRSGREMSGGMWP